MAEVPTIFEGVATLRKQTKTAPESAELVDERQPAMATTSAQQTNAGQTRQTCGSRFGSAENSAPL